MSRLGRLSLSPDPTKATPPLVGVPPVYKSGLVLHQQERNSPSYQSYKQKNHDYVNTEYILHTGSLTSRSSPALRPAATMVHQKTRETKGLVSKRSAAFEAFVQGTLQSGNSQKLGNQHKSVPNLISLNQQQQQPQQKSPFPMPHNGSAFQHIKQKTTPPVAAGTTFENYSIKSTSPYHQLNSIGRQPNATPTPKPASPFQRVSGQFDASQIQQQPVKVILSNGSLSNGNNSTSGSSYKSTIENKVKLMSQNHQNDTYVSNMHVRVPSQESSIYGDSRTYINLGQPVAMASKAGILLNPSNSQLNYANKGGTTKVPAIPRSQIVKTVIEPSYSSLLQNEGEQNQAIYANFDFGRSVSDGSNTEEEVGYASPPSPVSSSYSELRVATRVPLGHGFHHQMNPQAMIYDPLYEPISGQNAVANQHKPNFGLGGSSSHYDDSFGPCSKCLDLIVGTSTGCSAMGRLYHIKCFTCHHCGCQLQGKPYYALDGKPFCETDYLNTLEKCCKCLKPILDRILRATGKPYHPSCFTCVICGKSLDGIPFTVDASNQIHCIDDFHKRFAPKCSVCKSPIMPEPGVEETVRVVALDRSFHVKCYKCEDCGLELSSEAKGRGCYPLDDHVFCKRCNTNRIQRLTQGI